MQYVTGNLLQANTQALVNTVNTVGVMGKGIALQFKEAFPNNYKAYVDACKRGDLVPGKLLVVKEPTLDGEKIIVNFPTKTEWRLKSKYEYIEDGLKALADVIDHYKIKSIAIPPLGCGNGGLKWEMVKPLMDQYLGNLKNVEIEVYEPSKTVKELLKQQDTKNDAKLTHARAMLLYSMFYYESYGEDTSLFVANKLAYFLRRLGEKSLNNLRFEASRYGPYTVQVEHMLHNINGTYIKGLEQMNVKAFETLDLQYDKMSEVSEYVKRELSSSQKNILKNLTKLIDGFQSALSLEILASVDFVSKDKSLENDDIIRTIHNWSDRKRKLFQEKYINTAIDHLKGYGSTMEIR